jgi:hypothetical protein
MKISKVTVFWVGILTGVSCAFMIDFEYGAFLVTVLFGLGFFAGGFGR